MFLKLKEEVCQILPHHFGLLRNILVLRSYRGLMFLLSTINISTPKCRVQQGWIFSSLQALDTWSGSLKSIVSCRDFIGKEQPFENASFGLWGRKKRKQDREWDVKDETVKKSLI